MRQIGFTITTYVFTLLTVLKLLTLRLLLLLTHIIVGMLLSPIILMLMKLEDLLLHLRGKIPFLPLGMITTDATAATAGALLFQAPTIIKFSSKVLLPDKSLFVLQALQPAQFSLLLLFQTTKIIIPLW